MELLLLFKNKFTSILKLKIQYTYNKNYTQLTDTSIY